MLAINRRDKKEKVSLFGLYLGDLGNLSGVYCSAVLGHRHSAPCLLSLHPCNMEKERLEQSTVASSASENIKETHRTE